MRSQVSHPHKNKEKLFTEYFTLSVIDEHKGADKEIERCNKCYWRCLPGCPIKFQTGWEGHIFNALSVSTCELQDKEQKYVTTYPSINHDKSEPYLTYWLHIGLNKLECPWEIKYYIFSYLAQIFNIYHVKWEQTKTRSYLRSCKQFIN